MQLPGYDAWLEKPWQDAEEKANMEEAALDYEDEFGEAPVDGVDDE